MPKGSLSTIDELNARLEHNNIVKISRKRSNSTTAAEVGHVDELSVISLDVESTVIPAEEDSKKAKKDKKEKKQKDKEKRDKRDKSD